MKRIAAVVGVAALALAGCSIGQDGWTYEGRDALLVAVHHGTHRATAGVGFTGNLSLVDGCWRLGKHPVAWPKGTTWTDGSHTAVQYQGKTFRDGTQLGARAGGSQVTADRSSEMFTATTPCIPSSGTVTLLRFDDVD